MLDFLDRLREKPESVRIHISIAIAAVITGTIFFMWLSVTLLQFSNKADTPQTESTKDSPGIFSGFGIEIKEAYKASKKKTSSFLDALGTIRYESENTK